MAPGVLHRVIHGTPDPQPWQRALLTFRPALLQAHRRHRVRHADYPAILPHPGSTVRGTLVTGLTEGDIYRLDIFEGSQYSRQSVTVQILGHDLGLDESVTDEQTAGLVAGEAQADTYIWRGGEDTLEAHEWDFEVFKREKMRAWMGVAGTGEEKGGVEVDEGFADVDRAVREDGWMRQGDSNKNLAHDPMGGRGANGHITQQLEKAAV
ncbi:uncharacterized protein A1O9_12421 [Exophiala aquamarina CBS 119918]|uniref:Putative gamma-glutamylcyclotransferase n=1 Tax=Exophiala aquamarina CBS 119918 TaxID=1182545 RepID=A0A072NUF9_9EURO|nr:uncharacterized protein A1O9_12421 [Exophiala aquamarina CBS 119918]KEF51504.1 hypothetical protein A1O9_12421 [Exophiala aquamarina CBS 119918]